MQDARRRTPPSGPGLTWGTRRHTSRMISLGQLLERGGHREKLSLGETKVSWGKGLQGQRGRAREGEKPLTSGQERG